ncbi:porin [Jeongeupia chitinilytica]|uniref:Porin domain-containing protein n=1 Tax=Jeongeupia chitinilytica TaxID=1041641 RepID=A0ABQ3GY09_9NEIS|nr:porin [Jeongeupia chitinilytica]GHD56328.1 hypothetical protein GCM10007350_03170 [Jeongeupia chitinilytica]
MFKRALVAASLAAAFAAPAFAEVTIGGSIEADVYVHGSSANGFRDEVELDVEPRLFFSGSDKLDNGSKVIWKIWTGAENYRSDTCPGAAGGPGYCNPQNAANTGSSARTWGNREAWGGWQGDWGTLRFGKIYSPSYLKLDWPYGNLGGSMHVAEVGLISFNPQNSIVYDSPSFGGFTFSGLYSFRDQTNQNEGTSQRYTYDLTAGYSGGGFMIDAGYQQSRPETVGYDAVTGYVPNSDNKKDQFAFVAGGYNFGAFTVKGGYKWWKTEAGGQGTNSFSGPEQDQIFVQGIYSAGKNTVGLTYNYFGDAKNINGDKIDSSSSQVLYGQWAYALSNNTSAYVQGRFAWNDKNGGIGADYQTSYATDTNSYRLLVGTWTGF